MRKTIAIAIGLWLVGPVVAPVVAATSTRQAEPGGSAAQVDPAPVPERLEVEIVLSRRRGEERVAHLPYLLRLSEGGHRTRRASLRAALEVPVEVSSGAFQYKSVGTNIDCVSPEHEDGEATRRGSHPLTISIEHSAVVSSPAGGVAAPFEGAPIFSSFQIESDVWLSDGEAIELVSSTDPVTGEVLAIRVTLRVD